jgi:Protein of unknown function (DUF2892)
MLRRNVGGIDRVVRLLVGAILFCGGLFLLIGNRSLGAIVAVVGLLVLLTGVARFCALYIPFDISTAHSAEEPRQPTCDCQAWIKPMPAKSGPAGSPASSQPGGH